MIGTRPKFTTDRLLLFVTQTKVQSWLTNIDLSPWPTFITDYYWFITQIKLHSWLITINLLSRPKFIADWPLLIFHSDQSSQLTDYYWFVIQTKACNWLIIIDLTPKPKITTDRLLLFVTQIKLHSWLIIYE